jgi:hypothetical protein
MYFAIRNFKNCGKRYSIGDKYDGAEAILLLKENLIEEEKAVIAEKPKKKAKKAEKVEKKEEE